MKTYLIYDGRYFKIGRSLDIEKRLKSIKSHNPDATLLCLTDGDIEYEIHSKYQEYNYHNEWFFIPDDEIIKKLVSEFDYVVNEIETFKFTKMVGVNKISRSIEKMKIGGQINGKLRQNRSIRLINEAREKCYQNNEIPTQKKIAEMTGLGIATVKRNWKRRISKVGIKLKNK